MAMLRILISVITLLIMTGCGLSPAFAVKETEKVVEEVVEDVVEQEVGLSKK